MSQQWEYCILTTGFYSIPFDPPVSRVYAGVTFCQATENIHKVVEQKETPLERDETSAEMKEALIDPRVLTQIVARLGMAGWEMLSVHIKSHKHGTQNMLYFKRLVEPGRAIDDAF